jgi:hypothetical protein
LIPPACCGFRYLSISQKDTVFVKGVSAVSRHFCYTREGRDECTDPLLNRISEVWKQTVIWTGNCILEAGKQRSFQTLLKESVGEISVPGTDLNMVKINDKPIEDFPGIKPAGTKVGRIVFNLKPGE